MRLAGEFLLGLGFWNLRRGGEILGRLKTAITAKIKRMRDNHRPEGGPFLVSLCKQLQINLEKAHPQTMNIPLSLYSVYIYILVPYSIYIHIYIYILIMVPYSVRSLRGKELLEGWPANAGNLENASRHDTLEACIITSVSPVL